MLISQTEMSLKNTEAMQLRSGERDFLQCMGLGYFSLFFSFIIHV